jgi:hypothetical protein
VLRGEVGHDRVHVHGANGVAHDLGLLAHGPVRLAVLVVRKPVAGRALAARASASKKCSPRAALPRSSMK